MNKYNTAYKTIGEVAKILGLINKKSGNLNTHTIRYWEKEFKQIKPKIFSGNRRYYDNQNIELLKKVQFLLKSEGLTIKGVKKLLEKNNSDTIDDKSNKSINLLEKKNIKNKLNKISNLLKELKKIK
tara:strand:- start:1536 stop:1916 length:381 start_codon:yes stop_codon:yes gene_type:complete